MSDDRREKSQHIAKRLFGIEINPEREGDPFYTPALEHLFGEIWSRPGLALRDRSLVTIAALMVLGREREFAFHLRGALNVGVTPTEIEEMIVHLGYYGGFPTAATARKIAAEFLGKGSEA
ncbi:MAG: carboxymuconolactone decarboxylase family protein [Pseudomonadota bacterium]